MLTNKQITNIEDLGQELLKLGMKKDSQYDGWNYFFCVDLEVYFRDDTNEFVILHEGGELCSSDSPQLIYNVLKDIKECGGNNVN